MSSALMEVYAYGNVVGWSLAAYVAIVGYYKIKDMRWN